MSRSCLLVVAATDAELCGQAGLACGIGPVEAAAATARALALERPDAVLHVGVAGGARVAAGHARRRHRGRLLRPAGRDPGRFPRRAGRGAARRLRAALPDALTLPIGTSAAVDGPCGRSHRRSRSRGWRGSQSFAPARSPACRRVEVRASRTRSASPTGRAGRSRARSRRSTRRSRACSRRLRSSLPGRMARGREPESDSRAAPPAAAGASGRSASSSARPCGLRSATSGSALALGVRSPSSTRSRGARGWRDPRWSLVAAAFLVHARATSSPCAIVTGTPAPQPRVARRPTSPGSLVFIPFPLPDGPLFVLPGRPLARARRARRPRSDRGGSRFRGALRRGLGSRGPTTSTSLGGIATLALLVVLSRRLFFVLREFARQHAVAAAMLASLVVSAPPLPRRSAPVRRPGGSVTLARRPRKGATCRRT